MDNEMFIAEILRMGEQIIDKDGTVQANVYKFKLQGKSFVLKYYFDYENREGEILSVIKHPNVPKCYAWGYYKGRQYVIMDYCRGETLDKVGKLLPIHTATLSSIVLHLKDKGIAHHDIRPKHVLIYKDELYLVDFGAAESDEFPTKIRPEVLKINEKYSPDDELAIRMLVKEFG